MCLDSIHIHIYIIIFIKFLTWLYLLTYKYDICTCHMSHARYRAAWQHHCMFEPPWRICESEFPIHVDVHITERPVIQVPLGPYWSNIIWQWRTTQSHMFTDNKSELAMNRMLIKWILNTCYLLVNFALIYFSNHHVWNAPQFYMDSVTISSVKLH